MDTHYNPNRKVYESAFLSAIGQRDYLKKLKECATSTLIHALKDIHSTITDVLFRRTDKETDEEFRSRTLRQQYEALQDVSTVLKERDKLPNELEPFALNIDELPWNRHGPF